MAIFDIFKRKEKRQRRRPARRNFSGASTGNLFSSWSTTIRTPDSIVRDNLTALQSRSRDQFYNNAYVRRFVNMVQGNVVGPQGVIFQAQSLGRGGELDEPANKALEEAWRTWGRRQNCDLRQALNWPALQRQAVVSAVNDGEILARLYTGSAYGQFGFMVQHLDPGMLDPGYNTTLPGGHAIRMGIEYDARGRAVAFHFKDAAESLDGYVGYDGKHYVKVPARDILHLYLPLQVGQSRGYPWVAPVLQQLKMLDGYMESAVVAARAGAAKMGFLSSPDGQSYVGDDVDADGATVSEFEPGIIEQLPDGVTFSAFDPKYPHEQFDSFVKTVLRQICGGLGVAYSSLSSDLEKVNYSSSKIGLGEERSGWMVLQEWFIEGYCRPIYERWLEAAMLSEQVLVFGKPLAGSEDKYRRVSWQGRRWPSPDPAKDATAYREHLAMGSTTVSAIIKETTGRDPEEVFIERAAEKKRMDALGLTQAEVVQSVSVMEDEDEDE